MTQYTIYPNGVVTDINVPAGEYIAVGCYDGTAKIYYKTGPGNTNPDQYYFSQELTNGEVTLGTFAAARLVRIEAGVDKVFYEVGASPTITQRVPPTLVADAADTATGTGGALAFTGGAGGSTSGAGGAISLAGGAATAGNSAGGAASVTGGAGSGSSAGGAGSLIGGAAGATGTGGAIAVTGGAGGATSGAGGAVVITGGAATAGNSAGGAASLVGGAGQGTSAGGAIAVTSGAGEASAAATVAGASGAVTVSSPNGGANTGGATGQAGGAGGNVSVTGGAGGATNSDGAHAGGAGADLTFTAGAGGAASAGTGNGGAGGSITLTPGAGGTTTGGTAGKDGVLLLRGTRLNKQGAPAAKTTSTTLTAVEIIGGLLTVNQAAGGASALQLPLATDVDTALPDSAAGDSFDFSLINISAVAAEDASITTNTGWTLVGNMDVASNAAAADKSAGRFRCRKTGAGAWVAYRIA